MISEYSSEGNISKVTEMYQRMRREEVSPSCQTLTTAVAAFAKRKCLREGEKLHSFAFRSGVSDAILVASFVDFYAKCSRLVSSVQKDIVAWSSMIEAYTIHGYGKEALALFHRMLDEGVRPNGDHPELVVSM